MELSLYKQCVSRIVHLLKTCWNHAIWPAQNGHHENPFTYIPTPIIHDLISTMFLIINKSEYLKVSDLYHLLTCGQVEILKIDTSKVLWDDLVPILMAFSTSCQKLRSLTLCRVHIKAHNARSHYTKNHMTYSALECVLSNSPKLEYLESNIDFDLKSIKNCEHLKVLKLNFDPQSKIYDFLKEKNYPILEFWPNSSLEILEVYEKFPSAIDCRDVLPILKYCHALKQTNVDISMAVEELHRIELHNGSLSTQYKLEKCSLGKFECVGGAITFRAIHIATFTCPNLTEIDIFVNENETIHALRNFRHLSKLRIQWADFGSNYHDFQSGVGVLLHDIGRQLMDLDLKFFQEVNFSVIGQNCPSLEVLNVHFGGEVSVSFDESSPYFQHLTMLGIYRFGNLYCSEETLLMLLSNCPKLETLYLERACAMTDTLLQAILKHNSLAKVKRCTLLKCRLSYEGVRHMITHMKALEYLDFSSLLTDFVETRNMIHDINPYVIIRSKCCFFD